MPPVRPRPSWSWQEKAACRDLPVELFLGPEHETPRQRRAREARALAVCAGCPVRDACLAHALAQPEAYGVWGATTESQRAARRRAA